MYLKKVLFLSFLFLMTSNIHAQKRVAYLSDFLKSKNGYVDKTVSIIHPEKNDLSLFLIDGKRVYGYLMDENLKIKDSLDIEDKARKYKEIIGKSVFFNKDYTLFLTNKLRNKFATVSFSFETGDSEFNELKLDLTNQKFLQTAHYKNALYIITIGNNSSTLYLYKYENNLIPEKKVINLSKKAFKNVKGKQVFLYDLLIGGQGQFTLNDKINLVKIQEDNPNSLEVTSNFSKMYIRDNKVVFTFDENKEYTQIVSVNLDTYESTRRTIEKPLKRTLEKKKRNNTFVYGKNIYTISATSRLVALHAKNYSSGEEYKNHWALVTDSIYFKNSEIVQTGGMYSNYRELKGPKGTKKFIRKINGGNLAISVYKNDTNYTVTYGGIQEINRGGGMMMMPMGMGVPVANVGAVSFYVNPTAFAFEGYSTSRAVSIKALFDESFNHLNGEIPQNVFDKIKEYRKENRVDTKGETIFKYNGRYVLGFYDSWKRKYELVMFN
ncbi:hypothetical protein [uncultured Maribacter sp.]|uniref:hypothetical protein n=1 Tax=uncultured Maribacter sp. TaxID=431308 RepID=UPI002635C416|nr:hypothetical protein [uncultured Maribacter sp.]